MTGRYAAVWTGWKNSWRPANVEHLTPEQKIKIKRLLLEK
jgi:hypothetical protein